MNDQQQQLQDLIDEAQQLINTLADRSTTDEATFAMAYRLGYFTGHNVGHTRGYNEATDYHDSLRENAEARAIRINKLPTWHKLETARWDGPRTHFANPRPGDHPGGPVPLWGTTDQATAPAPDPWASLPTTAAATGAAA